MHFDLDAKSLSLAIDTRYNFVTDFLQYLYLFDSIFSIIVWTNRLHDFDEGICFSDNCFFEKWVKYIFTVIIATFATMKRCFHVKSSRACYSYLMDFLEIFPSGRYHRDIKVLKISASNSKQFRVYVL